MIGIKTFNEDENGFQLEIRIEGNSVRVASQFVSILDHFYEFAPKVFEVALLSSKYTEDHT